MRPCLMYTIGDSCVVIVVVKTATAGAVFCLHSHCIMNGRLGLDVGCTTLNHASIILRAISSRMERWAECSDHFLSKSIHRDLFTRHEQRRCRTFFLFYLSIIGWYILKYFSVIFFTAAENSIVFSPVCVCLTRKKWLSDLMEEGNLSINAIWIVRLSDWVCNL